MRREFERRDADTDEIEQLVSEIIASRPTSQRAGQGRSKATHFDRLKTSRKKYEKLRQAVRDDGFDAWVRKYLLAAKQPSEWTQARGLYENYLERAAKHGRNRGDKALSKLELATETQWGRMMGSLFPKKRRGKGWFYPVRLKRGA